MSLIESAIRFTFLALSVASVYALVAIGLSIVFGSLKYVNMAHGALYLLGAYVGLFIAFEPRIGGLLSDYSPIGLGWGFAAALILTPLVVFAIGVVMERVLAKPFYDRGMLDQLLVTFGVLLIIQEIVSVLIGRRGHSFIRPDWASGPMPLPGIGTASRWRIYVIVLTAIFLLLILAFYKYTDYGLAVRAGTEDTEMTELMGIRIGRPFLLIFAIGAGYAGLAGILGGSLFRVGPAIGFEIIIPALVIVIMGGVGSIKGTIVGAVLAGIVFAAVTNVWPEMARASIYALAIVVLTISPEGIYPKGRVEA